MQSHVSNSRGKVDVSAAVGGRDKHVRANQEGRVRAVECLDSRECLCLSAVSPLYYVEDESYRRDRGCKHRWR